MLNDDAPVIGVSVKTSDESPSSNPRYTARVLFSGVWVTQQADSYVYQHAASQVNSRPASVRRKRIPGCATAPGGIYWADFGVLDRSFGNMKRIWTLISLAVLLSVVAAYVASCRKDIFVPPPPSIIGTYRGVYEYSEDNNNGFPDDLDTGQFVKVIFKADSWIMNIDNEKTSDDKRMACDCNGDYSLENGVQLTLVDSNSTNKVCTYSWLPNGSFQLIQDENDSLCSVKMTRKYNDEARNVTITKRFCLYPSIL